MTIPKALWLPVLASAFFLSTAAVGKDTFDIATFVPPPGWERIESPGMLSFRTPASQKESAQILLFPSKPTAGSPQANFNSEWAKLVTTPLGAAPPAQLNTAQAPGGWTAVSGAVDVTQQGATFAVLLLTATGHERMVSVVVNMAGQAHLSTIDQFFRQLEFQIAASTPPPGAPQRPAESASPIRKPAATGASPIPVSPAALDKTRLVGLFYRLKVGMQSGARLEVEPRLFLPGNRIARTFPYGGGDTFDLAARCLPDTCGSYQLDGGTLSVRWDNGQADRWTFAVAGNEITLDGTTFRPARPMTEATLAGEWAGAGDTGNPFLNGYRFERGGVFTFGSGEKNPATGRYRLQGLTLTLTFADGTVSRRTLFAAGKTEPIGLISVEGEIYKRK